MRRRIGLSAWTVIGLILGLQGAYSKYFCFFVSLKGTFGYEKQGQFKIGDKMISTGFVSFIPYQSLADEVDG